MTADLTCAELVEQVTDLLENVLDADARQRFDEHLRDCDGCTDYVRQFEEIVRGLGHLDPEPSEALSDDVQRDLLTSFRQHRPGTG